MTDDPLTALAALADPARRRLYRLIEAEGRALGRDELAERTGLPRATVAFHLDKLVDAGVLVTEFAHRGEKRGPGSGRPAKFYALAQDELSAAIPPRRYDLAAELLARAVERADGTGVPVRACLLAVAAEQGRASGDPGRPLADTLDAAGYEPVEDAEGGYRLTNCPFHRLAARHTDLICSANVAFVGAISDESADRRPVWLEPADGGCCVRVGAASDAPASTAPAAPPAPGP